MKFASEISQLTERLETCNPSRKNGRPTGKKRLKEVEKILESGKYAADEQKQLAKLDKELAKLGYDASAHDDAREKESRTAQRGGRIQQSEICKEVSKQIESEIANLESEIANRKSEIEASGNRISSPRSISLESSRIASRRISTKPSASCSACAKRRTKPAVNWAAHSNAWMCSPPSAPAKRSSKRNAKNCKSRSSSTKRSERAFGKDGVPALLIEQALPQIEEKANDLLDRLSDGQMSIRFVTQAEYKDKKRDDLKETLDIQISDSAGIARL